GLWRQGDGGPSMGERLVRPPQSRQYPGKVVLQARVFGLAPDQFGILLARRSELPVFDADIRPYAASLIVFGMRAKPCRQCLCRFVGAPKTHLGIRKAAPVKRV